MEFVKVIERVVRKIAPGREPAFIEAHVIKTLETICEETIGRVKLSKILELGGGATRTLVRHLERERLIKVTRTGMTLSKFGKKNFLELRSKMSEEIEIPESPLTVGPFNAAILVKNVAMQIKYGVEQRDAAIRIGALGATTLIFRCNKLTTPGVSEELSPNIQTIRDTLISKLKPKENDVIIIGSAKNKRLAGLGAKAAAFELLKLKAV